MTKEDPAKYFVIVTDPDGVVLDIHGYADVHDADKQFKQTCQGYGREPQEEHYSKGRMELQDNSTVALEFLEEPLSITEVLDLLSTHQ
jgi:hypothetical protein